MNLPDATLSQEFLIHFRQLSTRCCHLPALRIERTPQWRAGRNCSSAFWMAEPTPYIAFDELRGLVSRLGYAEHI